MSGRPELRQHLLFIADLSAGLQEIQERSALSAEARGRCARWRERATELEAFLKNRPGVAMPVDAGDLADLPPELLSELSGSHADPLEAQIMAVLQDCGGRADLDQLLIGLYRKFETVQKRRFLQNKLWRMVRKGRLHKAGKARGMFALAADKERGRKARRRR